ncbi:hypothetical protein DdX_15590 [Ditylenchus destructor]|uniref:Uncharacterized protein n=1 Tax=Ditylenchus destructor TaxID=166010 RepID=A0AAD4QXK1_9BILA|nr:hypothetical protein DdX_15590 [Ditylenchus destructor]
MTNVRYSSASKLTKIQALCLLSLSTLLINASAGRTNEKAKYLNPPVPLEESLKYESHLSPQDREAARIEANMLRNTLYTERLNQRVRVLEVKAPAKQKSSGPSGQNELATWLPRLSDALEVLIMLVSAIFAMLAVMVVIAMYFYCRKGASGSIKYAPMEKFSQGM